ncbi:MAG: flippase [Anaerolineae bacterium]|nr:flippase [Anaerolineae bacterium]
MLSRVHHVVRNYVYALLADISQRAAAAILMVLVSRQLGVAEAGIYFLAVSFALIFSRLALWGLDQLLIRDVAQTPDQADAYFVNFLALRLVLSLFALMALAFVVSGFIHYAPHTERVILIYGLTILPAQVSNICQALFIARERMGYLAGVSAFAGFTRLAAGLTSLWAGLGLEGVVGALLLASLVEMSLNLAIVWRRFLRPRWQLDWSFCRRQLGVAFPFLFIGVSYILENQLDSVLLSVLKGEQAVGIYGAAAMVLSALLLIPYAYQRAIYPAMSRLYATSRAALQQVYAESMRYLFLVALPIAVGGTILAEPIMVTVFRAEFLQSARVLQVLLWVTFLLFLHMPNARLMVISNNQSLIARFLVVTLGVNVVLNVVLIPRWGATGAAVARLASTSALVLLSYGFVYRRIYAYTPIGTWLRPALAAAVMALALIFLQSLALYALIPLGAAVYFVALVGLGALSWDDLALLHRLLGGAASLESQ